MKQIVKLAEAEKYKNNPFMGNDQIKLDVGKKSTVIGAGQKLMVDNQTGAVDDSVKMFYHKYRDVDRTQFVKLYVSEIASLFDMSKTALKILGYILGSLKPKKDELYIYLPELAEYCGYNTSRQLYRGLVELINNEVITQSIKPNMWFINPAYLFNGDRLVFIRDYRTKEAIDEIHEVVEQSKPIADMQRDYDIVDGLKQYKMDL